MTGILKRDSNQGVLRSKESDAGKNGNYVHQTAMA